MKETLRKGEYNVLRLFDVILHPFGRFCLRLLKFTNISLQDWLDGEDQCFGSWVWL